jgi:hypothetical protein
VFLSNAFNKLLEWRNVGPPTGLVLTLPEKRRKSPAHDLTENCSSVELA